MLPSHERNKTWLIEAKRRICHRKSLVIGDIKKQVEKYPQHFWCRVTFDYSILSCAADQTKTCQ